MTNSPPLPPPLLSFNIESVEQRGKNNKLTTIYIFIFKPLRLLPVTPDSISKATMMMTRTRRKRILRKESKEALPQVLPREERKIRTISGLLGMFWIWPVFSITVREPRRPF